MDLNTFVQNSSKCVSLFDCHDSLGQLTAQHSLANNASDLSGHLTANRYWDIMELFVRGSKDRLGSGMASSIANRLEFSS